MVRQVWNQNSIATPRRAPMPAARWASPARCVSRSRPKSRADGACRARPRRCELKRTTRSRRSAKQLASALNTTYSGCGARGRALHKMSTCSLASGAIEVAEHHHILARRLPPHALHLPDSILCNSIAPNAQCRRGLINRATSLQAKRISGTLLAGATSHLCGACPPGRPRRCLHYSATSPA